MMKPPTHSPGPWVRRYNVDIYGAFGDHICRIDFDAGNSETRVATAILIAEAPTLLATLEKLSAWFVTDPPKDAFTSRELLLAGCPNELRADLENAREAIAAAKNADAR